MTAYYNEIDPYAAQWLRNLIAAGQIAPGDVDERSIVDVRPDDLRGYDQCHFFAGIGGWSLALRYAGYPDDGPVWTGSCPCQPFSAAGKGEAANDERHLWPFWFPLIAERRPAIVFGEQVEAAIGWGWLDAVFAELEGEGYACGASVLPACSVGAPHIRQRLWFVAHDPQQRCGQRREDGGGGSARASTETKRRSAEHSDGGMADTEATQRGGASEQDDNRRRAAETGGSGVAGCVADSDGGDASTEGLQRGGQQRQQPQDGELSYWPTPNGEDMKAGSSDVPTRKQVSLPRTASRVTSWPTPTVHDAERGGASQASRRDD